MKKERFYFVILEIHSTFVFENVCEKVILKKSDIYTTDKNYFFINVWKKVVCTHGTCL